MIAASRVMSIVSLYFALIVLLPLGIPVPWLLLAVFLCGLSCGLAERTSEKGLLRYVWLLLLPLMLIPGGMAQRLALLLPIIYAGAMICTDFLYADKWRSAPVFKLTLIPYFLGMGIATALSKTAGWKVLLFGMLYFVFRVLALRLMRMGRGVRLKGTVRDFGVILTLPAAAAILAAVVYGGKELLKWLGIVLVQFVGWAMNLLVRGTMTVSNVMIALRKTPEKRPEHTIPETFHEATMEAAQESSGVYEALQNILIVILALAAIAAVLLLIRSLVRRVHMPASGKLPESWDEATESITAEKQAAPERIASNRREIRRIYARYLRLIQERGFSRRKADTSREVLESSEDFALPWESKALREIYIRARYDSGTPVTTEDVKAAKALLQSIQAEQREE